MILKDIFVYSPDRWAKVPEAANSVPGVWGNLLTFLGGARSCIGYRFALVEYVRFPCIKFNKQFA